MNIREEVHRVLNVHLLMGWILSYACKHKHYKVMHTFTSALYEEIEFDDWNDSTEFNYPMYAFVYHLIDNMKTERILMLVDAWKSCVNYVEQLYCKSHKIPLGLFISLSTKIKFLTVLHCFKETVDSHTVIDMINEYFPTRTKFSQAELMRRYGIKSSLSRQLQAIFDKYGRCRTKLIDFMVHFEKFEQNYENFMQTELVNMSKQMEKEITTFLQVEINPKSDIILEKILDGTYNGEDENCQNEVNFVKNFLRLHVESKTLTEESLVLMLKLLSFDVDRSQRRYLCGTEADKEISARQNDAGSSSNVDVDTVDSQQLIEVMQVGSSNRRTEVLESVDNVENGASGSTNTSNPTCSNH